MYNFSDEQKRYLKDTYKIETFDNLDDEIADDLLFTEADEIEKAGDDESKLSDIGKMVASIIDEISRATNESEPEE